MDNSLLANFLSGRELLFLGTGAAAFGVGATRLHVRGTAHARVPVRRLLASVATAFLVSGALLARCGF